MPALLIAYDGTDNAQRAVHYAGRFLQNHDAVVLTVWEPMRGEADPVSIDLDGPPDPSTDEPDIALADAQRINAEGVRLANEHGMTAEPLCVAMHATVWRTIIGVADQLAVDLIITGTRGHTGLRSLLQSSVADHVLRYGKRPVLIVPPGSVI